MDILGLFLLSVPIFYIWGFISFISLFRKKSPSPDQPVIPHNPDRMGYLKAAINELKNFHPQRTVSDLLTDYQAELSGIPAEKIKGKEDAKEIASVGLSYNLPNNPVTQASGNHDTASFQNWYKDNSINLLLYIGAFLIIVSATIFAGLEGIQGVMKAGMLTGLSALFLGAGLVFSTLPRVKNAGVVFAGIGALLIPIAGIGWYKFVFEPIGGGIGGVWLMTSCVGLLVYLFLARYFKSVFYAYVTSLSSLSFSFALVNISGLENDYYLLASMMSSILLFGVSNYFRAHKSEGTELFTMPFNLTANVVMPVALFYGVMTRLQSGDPFTFATTASIFLGSLFYVLSYISTKIPWHIVIALMLSSLGLVYFGNLQEFDSFTILLLVSASVYLDLFLVYFFQERKKAPESDAIALFGIIKMGLIIFFAIVLGLQTLSVICFCGLGIAVGIIWALLKQNVYYSAFSSIVTIILLYFGIHNYLGYELSILGLSYLVSGVLWYVVTVYWKTKKDYVDVFGFSAILNFFVSSITIGDTFGYQIVNTLVIAGVCFSAGRIFAKKELIYLANVFIAFATISYLKLHKVDTEYYPLVFTALAYVYYIVGKLPGIRYKKEFVHSGLVGIFITPLFLGFFSLLSFGGGSYDNNLEKNALISSYAAVILYSLEAVLRNSSAFGYTASAIGIFTYMWQIHYLGATNIIWYTLVLGLYFCVLAYLRRKAVDQSLRQLFDVLGIGFLIVPTWFKSFGGDGITYAFLLGVIGIMLLAIGITVTRKAYRYSGILAIVLAVMSQSRWAIIGVAGLAFLGLALYLLLFRKEDKQK